MVIAANNKQIVNTKVIRLFELTNRIGWSHYSILRVLNQAGYNLPTNNPNIYLNSEHITVLSHYYIKAIKDFQKQKFLNKDNLSSKELFSIRLFLRRFVSKENYDNKKQNFESRIADEILTTDNRYINLLSSLFFEIEPDILLIELDEDRIRDFFLNIAYSNLWIRTRVLSDVMSLIKITINQIFNDVRKRIFILLFSNQYHIFSSDDDHNRVANRLIASL
jgi:hypothetical protein